jgi:hypothetical protein
VPPPSPSNLNKWLIGGSILLVAVGLMTSLRAKKQGGPFVIEKDVPAVEAGTVDAASDALQHE